MPGKNETNGGAQNVTDRIEHVIASLSTAREEARRLEAEISAFETQVHELEQRAVRARGTGDVTEAATKAVMEVAADSKTGHSLAARIEHALRHEPLTLNQLAKTVGAATGPVNEALKIMRAEHKLYNVGSGDYPIWIYKVGDEIETKNLVPLVRKLISERAMTTKEISEATGVRETRCGGAIISLQQSKDDDVRNMGSKKHARWFLVSDRMRPANLKPQR